MCVHAEGPAVGKDAWSGGAHQSGAHRRSERCAHTHGGMCALLIQGAVCAHTKTSVHTYKDQWVHIHGAVCALHIQGALCAHTQVEIVVV